MAFAGEKQRKIFDAFDKNGDGWISFIDFSVLKTSMCILYRRARAFAYFETHSVERWRKLTENKGHKFCIKKVKNRCNFAPLFLPNGL